MEDLLKGLNEQQRAAVEYNEGPSLIIAGAGSGKTRVLTHKIAYLLKQGYHPQSLLALTFTNKAAREMKERIAELVGERLARSLWMGTFHSIFSRMLRTEAESLGFKSSFTIFDSADSRNLIRTIIKENQLDDKIYIAAAIQAAISNAKNALISPHMYANNTEIQDYDRRSKTPLLKDIYAEYHSRLKISNTMDFDDLLFYINRLFRDKPEILASYQERFQFILVDEYQDTNFAQYLAVNQLANKHHRVCVVGDDAQSIYSFRGANIDNILKFKEVYPEAKLFKLEQNYRSTQNIVNAANSLISQNKEQIQKRIYSEKNEGDRIELISAYSDFEEGMIVTNKIWEMRTRQNASYNNFVILYRTNSQSRIFEESLRKKNIPYRIYGGLSFYQRKEIKDVIAYFRMIVNPLDEEAFKRSVNFPARGIGATTISRVSEAAQKSGVSMWDIISNPMSYALSVNSGIAKRLAGFKELINSFIEDVDKLNAYEMAAKVLKGSGVAGDAYKDQSPEGMSRQENLQELLGGIHEFCETRREEGEENIGLLDFLAEVSLLTDQDANDEAEQAKVTMMTVHASKGLEFKNVFIVGLEEDLFPSAMAKNEMRGLEEERRLFYVAITRAEEYCMMSYAKSRFRHGQIVSGVPSRFLREIDEEYMELSLASLGTERATPSFLNTRERQLNTRSNVSQRTRNESSKPLVSVESAINKPIAKGNTNIVSILEKGSIIKHERFGIGKVLDITGDEASRKATVEFENSGLKQLLLKFARFDLIE